MSNVKITDLVNLATPALADLLEIVDDVAGTPTSKKVTLENIKALIIAGLAASGANADITSMTGLSDDGIPLAKVDGAADALFNLSEDTTPELGGELDCGAHSVGFTQQSGTGDGTTTIDWKLGNKYKHTFGSQNETFTFTAPSNPCNLLLVLIQDGTGSRTVTWPATVKWPGGTAPTLTTDASSIDIVSFYYDGTNYFGVASLAFAVPA